MIQTKQPCFVLEGNIGAGKSTFLKIIKNHLPVTVIFEPHTEWQKVQNGENLLEKFYVDPTRWAYTFQTYAFVTRVRAQLQQTAQDPFSIQILERSVFSDRFCFAKNAFELGYMSALEWNLYQEWFGWLVDSYLPMPSGFIYLQTNPAVCYQRLCKRSRQEERGVSCEYLQRLHEKHEEWLIKKEHVTNELARIPVLILNVDTDFEHSSELQKSHIERIRTFINQQRQATNTPLNEMFSRLL